MTSRVSNYDELFIVATTKKEILDIIKFYEKNFGFKLHNKPELDSDNNLYDKTGKVIAEGRHGIWCAFMYRVGGDGSYMDEIQPDYRGNVKIK